MGLLKNLHFYIEFIENKSQIFHIFSLIFLKLRKIWHKKQWKWFFGCIWLFLRRWSCRKIFLPPSIGIIYSINLKILGIAPNKNLKWPFALLFNPTSVWVLVKYFKLLCLCRFTLSFIHIHCSQSSFTKCLMIPLGFTRLGWPMPENIQLYYESVRLTKIH